MDINPIRPGAEFAAQAAGSAQPAGDAGGVAFKDLLADAVAQVNNLQQAADVKATQLAAGSGAVDEVMIAVQKADLALQMTMTIRNKLVDAYQEVSRMQI